MGRFRYQATTEAGKQVSGTTSATSIKTAMSGLAEQGYSVSTLRPLVSRRSFRTTLQPAALCRWSWTTADGRAGEVVTVAVRRIAVAEIVPKAVGETVDSSAAQDIGKRPMPQHPHGEIGKFTF